MPSSLVDVRDLSVRFSSGGGALDAVKHVSFSVAKGEIVALVGESGSGKTVSALSIMRHDVPGLVAALRALADEHQPDENGYCGKCRSGPFWRRVAAPCRMLLAVHLAVGAATATTRARQCPSSRRHELRTSPVD